MKFPGGCRFGQSVGRYPSRIPVRIPEFLGSTKIVIVYLCICLVGKTKSRKTYIVFRLDASWLVGFCLVALAVDLVPNAYIYVVPCGY